ncbi:MAG: SUMF1/EgtB/PvdO family nonheme iron enzyme [Saprospiraceae bacterium]
MDNLSLVIHFMAPHFISGSDVLADQEFEAVQKYIRQPDIFYIHKQVVYADLWEKTTDPLKPDLLHIVAHGDNGQLLTADAYLQSLKVDAHVLAKDLKSNLGSHIKYIYLGMCDSVALARELAEQGYTVLCFEGKVVPERGVFFAETFYKFFLQAKKDFYAAFTAAKNSWKANGYHEKGVVPRFYCAASAYTPQFVWDVRHYKAFLEKLRGGKQPQLVETLFEELKLDASILQPWNLPVVYRYLKDKQALFLFRDRAETYFLGNRHAYTPTFMDIEEGLLKAYIKPSQPNKTQKYTAIAETDLEYARQGLIGKKTLTKKGLSKLAKELVLPLGLDFERTKAHLMRENPVLQVGVLSDDANSSAMSPEAFVVWMIKHKKKFFVIEGAAGTGKTTFLTDTVRAHFRHLTKQKVFIARFSHVDELRAQLEEWEKDAIENILVLDALDELYDDGNAIFGILTKKNNPVRAFSKVVLSFRDTFLNANQSLKKAIDEEDWTLLRMAPLQFTHVQNYLRECFPPKMQEEYGAALRYVKAGDTLPPVLQEGVTAFLLYHIQFLLEEPPKDGPLTYWDVMNQLVNKIMEKGSPLDGRKNPVLKQKLLAFFMDKVWQVYLTIGENKPFVFALGQQDFEDLEMDERLLRNFSLLSKIENETGIHYTFSHSHFKDYFLALLIFEGRIPEVGFDKGKFPDAYRLYQDYCWKQIAPGGTYRYDWHPVVASGLPCFAFQVMVHKHGGELPLKYPSVSKYFRAAFEDWHPQTWEQAKTLAAGLAEGQDIRVELENIQQHYLVEVTANELAQVVDFGTKAFRHPLYRDVFAFLYHQERGREEVLAFLDESDFGWLFRHEWNWLAYGEQTEVYSLVYEVKDNGSVYGILEKAIGVNDFTDFDQEIYAALQTPTMLERYYEKATSLHVQVHATTLAAHLLNGIPFPEQFVALSIGGKTALEGDWDLSTFENLKILNLSNVDIRQLRIAKCPPLLETIIHPQADLLPIADTPEMERLTCYMAGHWTEQVPDTPLPPELVKVEGGAPFEMGEGWFEATQAFMKEYYKKEIPESDRSQYPTYMAAVDTFYMAKYPVTVREFARFVKAKPYPTRAERFGFAFAVHDYEEKRDNQIIKMYVDYLLPGLHWRHSVWSDGLLDEDSADLPVVYISYEDAEAYAKWLTDTIGNGGVYRLPTEAEWEYAAKGGSLTEGYRYAGSNNIDEVAQYIAKEPMGLRPVGAAHLAEMGKANELGLYDMSGNVLEWCRDWYEHDYYAQCKAAELVPNPIGPESGAYRVVRGGSWGNFAEGCRSACRDRGYPDYRCYNIGFRLVFVP